MNRLFASLLLLMSFPILFIAYVLVKLDSKGPFIFRQKRMGKNKKPFTMYKIRTMIEGAEKLQKKYAKINEADGPVFKIKNDPRYTKVGKFLSKSALDELPQLLNVLKGEMALVGPRPLPVAESAMVPRKYDLRFSVLPGMTSTWITSGAHRLTFDEWMKLDLEYIDKKSIWLDFKTFIRTLALLARTHLEYKHQP